MEERKDKGTELADIDINFEENNSNRPSLGKQLDSKRKFKEDNWVDAD